MRMLVLGGTRFIGRALTAELARGDHEVAVMHRGAQLGGSEADLPNGVCEFLLDRRDLLGNTEALVAWRPEVVVDMYAMTKASARATLAALASGVRRWVVASSMDVYRVYDRLQGHDSGPPLPGLLVEDSPLRQRLYPYRGADREAEFSLADYEKIEVERAVTTWPEVESVVVRLPAVYGPRDAQHRLAADLSRMDRGDAVITLGASEAAWRFAMGYVDDVAHALALAATHPAARGAYHVADPETLTRAELLAALAAEADWDGIIEVVSDEDLPADRRSELDYRQHMASDSSKIRRELGYSELVSRREALRRTIAWERAERERDAQTA